MMVLFKSTVFFRDLKLKEVYSTFYEINKSNLYIFGNSSLFSQDIENRNKDKVVIEMLQQSHTKHVHHLHLHVTVL